LEREATVDQKYCDWRQFQRNLHPTIGVEIELAVLHPQSLDLAPHSLGALAALPVSVSSSGRSGSELQSNSIELRTGICADVSAVRRDLGASLAALHATQGTAAARYCGLGMHPYARWQHQQITPLARPQAIARELQCIAKRAAVFGLHVHVGVRSGERAVAIMNALIPALPVLLALSANSPFCEGEDSGLASMRRQVLASMPRSGLPQSVIGWSQWVAMMEQLHASGHVSGFRDLWWDVRLNPMLGTIEVRICDMPSTLDEVVALAALIQALVVALDREQIKAFAQFSDCAARAIAESNLWSAARHGGAGKIVDFYRPSMAPTEIGSAALRLLDRVQSIASELGSAQELDLLRQIARAGGGATHQRRVFASEGSLRGVVDQLSASMFAPAARLRAPIAA
jgi:carboxylate-amine ligase